MKILNRDVIDECTGRGHILEVLIDNKADEWFVRYLEGYCDVVFMRDKKKPVYVARKKNMFMIKGLIGSDTISVVFEKERLENNIEEFLEIIENYENK